MARPEQYQQRALDFSIPAEPLPRVDAHPTPSDAAARDEAPMVVYDIRPDINGDPDRPLPNDRLPHDFWNEYINEYAFRERHLMAPIGPQEFADMRDAADGIIEPSDFFDPCSPPDDYRGRK